MVDIVSYNQWLNILELINSGDYENFGEDYDEQITNLENILEWINNYQRNNNDYTSQNLIENIYTMLENVYYDRNRRIRQQRITQRRRQQPLPLVQNNYNITSLEGVLTDDDNCSICLELLTSDLVLINNCRHIFHRNCLTYWARVNRNCPLCRSSFFGTR